MCPKQILQTNAITNTANKNNVVVMNLVLVNLLYEFVIRKLMIWK